MTKILFALVLLTSGAMAETRTYRDAMGRETGRAETHGDRTTFRDAMGRETGRSETNRAGVTTYRDNLGRETGRSR